MTENERLDTLINTLIHESSQYRNLAVPEDLTEKRNLLRALLNVRPPKPISYEFIRLRDTELQKQLRDKGEIVIKTETDKTRYVLRSMKWDLLHKTLAMLSVAITPKS